MSSTEHSKYLDELEKIHHKTVEVLNSSKPLDVSALRKNVNHQHIGFPWRESLIVVSAISLGLYLGVYVL